MTSQLDYDNLTATLNAQKVAMSRTQWIDVCRVIALFGVIAIHVAGPVVKEYRAIPLDAFLAANAIDSLARVSVPLFAMISGALLLGRSASIDFVVTRVFRVALPLVFWSFIHVIWINSWTGKQFDVVETIRLMWQAPVMYHLWFVYMIIGVYILLPILRVMIDFLISDQKAAIYFFCLWFIVNSMTVYYQVALIQQLNLSSFMGWPGYFMLGYYLNNSMLSRCSGRISRSVFILATLGTFYLNWRLNESSLTSSIIAHDYFSPNVVIAAIAAFLWLKTIKIPDRLVKPFAFVSGLTFPMYFMHIIIMSILMGKNHGLSMTPYFIHPALGILVLTMVTFLVSMALASVSRFIPYSSRLIG